MSEINNGGPAFPQATSYHMGGQAWSPPTPVGGMSLRDYFAAQAMPKLMVWDVDANMSGFEKYCEMAAKTAYAIADAMLAARAAK